jgi:hypothetical protein
MTEPEKFSLDEAHKVFAKKTNGRVWQLLGQESRTSAEDDEMLLTAQASLYHWLQAGTAVHAQRGHWLLAHVYTLLGDPALALKHAARCLEIMQGHLAEMEDFDIAYAYEGLARANALGGNTAEARKYFDWAKASGEKISDREGKDIFLGDFQSGPWFGIN